MKSSDLFETRVSTKRLDWDSNPSIGWFIESNPFRVYYGAHIDDAANILENGIYAEASS